jgi:hypothetical protein
LFENCLYVGDEGLWIDGEKKGGGRMYLLLFEITNLLFNVTSLPSLASIDTSRASRVMSLAKRLSYACPL